ncbi:MAG TPA: NADH-quinone oxidoreductase subunit C [Cyclobacteriaceae bacterium]|nr:NADH-quinone oxidoreductase subunit C [Cyclobacteriaceae bacterium]
MAEFESIVLLVKSVARSEVKEDLNLTPKGIVILPDDLVDICKVLHENPSSYFDMLSCVTGIDNGVEAGTMEVIYNLYSIPFNHHFTIRVVVPRDNPEVHTVSHIWKTADWHEREAYDLLGINFINHSDLRRILLPADWEGHPLRKDYQHQEYYRGVKVEY